MAERRSYHLINALKALAEKNNVSQAEVSRKTGFNTAHISRIFSGFQDYVDPADLDKIIDAVAKTDTERGLLLKARIQDIMVGVHNLKHLRMIVPGDPEWERAGRMEAEERFALLDPKVKESAFFLLEQTLQNKDLGEALVNWARMFKRLQQ